MINDRKVGLAPLTLVEVSPPELVGLAESVGFDFVGLRVSPSVPGETVYPMLPGSPMLKETVRRLLDSPVGVVDIDVFALHPDTKASDFLLALESGAELGATHCAVVDGGCERSHFTETFGELAEVAQSFGITPVVEPITYRGVNSIRAAAEVSAVHDNTAMLIDSLHFFRFGGKFEELAQLPASKLPFFQLCDAPLEPPTEIPDGLVAPMNQSTGGSPLQFEARAMRLLPGTGELPLEKLVRAMPDGLPISVETPLVIEIQRFGVQAFAERVFKAIKHFLVGMESE
ncbi:sugar phosphate isomerase/epimerase [Saccharopolyspora sp. ASAGF58]|uniref:sugar phosphate isomerase/epimerase family protein n=1 Tax=Saccharopolyspora sp. ASAGF58 TaxID=2719023 RepID=UPI001B31877C|nr:TIM barrel protein [Saccharopolyspora sp. ASAGF58]